MKAFVKNPFAHIYKFILQIQPLLASKILSTACIISGPIPSPFATAIFIFKCFEVKACAKIGLNQTVSTKKFVGIIVAATLFYIN